MAGAQDTLDGAREGRASRSKKVTDELLADGLKKFVEPFTKLLKAVERRCREANQARINAPDLHAARGARTPRSTERARGLGRPGRHAAALGRRRVALDGNATRRAGSAGSGIVEQQLGRPHAAARTSRTR